MSCFKSIICLTLKPLSPVCPVYPFKVILQLCSFFPLFFPSLVSSLATVFLYEFPSQYMLFQLSLMVSQILTSSHSQSCFSSSEKAAVASKNDCIFLRKGLFTYSCVGSFVAVPGAFSSCGKLESLSSCGACVSPIVEFAL